MKKNTRIKEIEDSLESYKDKSNSFYLEINKKNNIIDQ